MFKGTDAAPSVFGSRIYIMNNDTLIDRKIKKGSAVFVKEGLMPTVERNDIILVSYPDTEGAIGAQPGPEAAEGNKSKLAMVLYCGTHDVYMPDGTVATKYIVKYGNVSDDNCWLVDAKDIIGMATSYDNAIGAVIRFVSSKAGMLVMVIIPCAFIVIYQVAMLIIAIKRKKMEYAQDFEDNPGYLDNYGVPDSSDISLNFGHNSPKPSNTPDFLQQPAGRNQGGGRTAPKPASHQPEGSEDVSRDMTIKFTPGSNPAASDSRQSQADYWESFRRAQRRPEAETGYQPGVRTASDSVKPAARPNPPSAPKPTPKPAVPVSPAKPAAQPTVKPTAQDLRPASDTKPAPQAAPSPAAPADKRDASQRIDELMRMLKEETERLNKK